MGLEGQTGGIQQGVSALQTTIGYTPPPGVGGEVVTFTQGDTGAVTRALTARLRDDAVSVADYQTAIAINDQAAVFAAISTGRPVKVPGRSAPYQMTDFINLASGAFIFGEGRPTIKATSHGRIFRLNALSGVTIKGIIFDGNKAGVTTPSAPIFLQNATDCLFEDCDFLNSSSNMSVTVASKRNRFVRCRFFDSAGTALELNGSECSDNQVLFCEFQRNAGFGTMITNGANRNLVQGCWTNSNTIELIGITYSGHSNRIINNHAEGTGDNGISITGYGNVVMGNRAYRNAFHGICIYGKWNTVVGNSCVGNGQSHNPAFLYYDVANVSSYGGLTVSGFFGGAAQVNSISGNFIDDDQATPTQFNGIRINGAGYANWAASTAVAGNSYLRNSLNIYFTTAGGTTGTTAPTHTSGSVSDGGVTWLYVDTFNSTGEPNLNVVSGNTVFRFAAGGAKYFDGTVNHNNTIYADDHFEMSGAFATNTVGGGFTRRASIWTSGQAVVYGDVRYSDALNVVYRCTNLGGSGTTKPSHASGTVTGADGIRWVAINTQQSFAALTINTGDVRVGGVFQIPVSDNTAFVKDLAGNGSPEGVVTAPVGSRFMRADGSAGATFYVKESGVGASGWVAK